MCFILWFVVKVLDFSLPQLIRGIVKELKPVVELKWMRASVNGVLVIGLVLLVILYFFVDRLKQAIEILHNLQHPAASSAYEILLSLFLIGIIGLLSLHALPKT